jgi:hypothetical protein
VLEDDIVVGNAFLDFMNAALDRYEAESRVWHVSGWNYPMPSHARDEDAFLWRVMNCWGWATWADRWEHFTKDTESLVANWSDDQRQRFNVDRTHPFWEQVLANQRGEIDTWAIYWYATIFQNDGLCLNPYATLTRNIGLDGSGTHGGPDLYPHVESSLKEFILPDKLEESAEAVGEIKDFFRATTPGETIGRHLFQRLKRLVLR